MITRREVLKLLGIGMAGGMAGLRPAPARLFAEDFDAADVAWDPAKFDGETFHVTLIATNGGESEPVEAIGHGHREGDCVVYEFDDLVFAAVPAGACYTHVGYRHPEMGGHMARGLFDHPVMSNGGDMTISHGRLDLARWKT